VAFRGLEILLGRVASFQETVPFTTDRNATAQPVKSTLGNGTFAALFLGAQREREVQALGKNGTFAGIGGTAQSLGSAVVTAGAGRVGDWRGKGGFLVAVVVVGLGLLL